MKSVGKNSLVFILIAAVLSMWGYAYEVSYFYGLGLSVDKDFGIQEFGLTGAMFVFPMVIVLLLFAQLKKFFTKRVHEDDVKTVLDRLSRTTFAEQIVIARIAVVASFVYWIFVFLAPRVGVTWPLWHIFGYMVFVNLVYFYGAFYLSPSYSRLSVLVSFLLSVSLCYSAGGYALAKDAHRTDPVVRDDIVVRIVRTADGHTVEIKPIRLPLPLLRLLDGFK